jgi:Domain of Unknown Function (DUF928)
MNWIKQSLCLLAICLPLSAEMAPTIAAQMTLSKGQITAETTNSGLIAQFKPPKVGQPPASAGGGTRGSACTTGDKKLSPLLPKANWGLTTAERPTFFWYQPKSSSKKAEFVLTTEKGEDIVYETNITLSQQAGIMNFTMPPGAPILEKGKRYRWFLTVVCREGDVGGNPTIDGWIDRVEQDSDLKQALVKGDKKKLAKLYAEKGLWYEAINSLAELKIKEPNNNLIRSDWQKLLNSVGLNSFMNEKLIILTSTAKSTANL